MSYAPSWYSVSSCFPLHARLTPGQDPDPGTQILARILIHILARILIWIRI